MANSFFRKAGTAIDLSSERGFRFFAHELRLLSGLRHNVFSFLFRIPLLTPEGEVAIFRKLNYLKFKADRRREPIDPETVSLRP